MASVIFQCIDMENLNPLRHSIAVCRLEIGMRSEGKQRQVLIFGELSRQCPNTEGSSHTSGPCVVMMLHICSEGVRSAAVMDY